MEPSLATIKRLFAASCNKCAYPNCELPIVEKSGTVTGIICHIKARSRGGPRYDRNQTEAECHSFDNLILMCGRHSKLIDSEPGKFTVELLKEIKELHERNGNIDILPGDADKAGRLLEDYRKYYSITAGGNVMIDSPGAIQAQNIVFKTEKKTVRLNPPAGTIAADRQMRNYVKHLIDRYHEYASQQPGRNFTYPAIYADIKKAFGAKWDHISTARFDELCRFLHFKIDRTMIGSMNRGKGYANYSSFDEFVKRYDQ